MNDFIEMGKELSEKFVKTGEDLTENLQKIAIENSLNQQQIQRVAESANVETYLKLAHVVKDSYIEFPVADPHIVITNLEKTATPKAHLFEDQWENIKYRMESLKMAGDILDVNIEKTASNETPGLYKDMPFHEVSRKSTSLIYGVSEINSKEFEMYNKYAELVESAKQALAFGYKFEDVKQVVKIATAVDSDYSKLIVANLNSDLGYYFPPKTFEKVAQENKVTVTDSKLYKDASFLINTILDLDKGYENIVNDSKELLDIYQDTDHKHYIKEAIGKVDVKKIPVKKALKWLGIGGLGGVVAGTSLKNKTEKYKNSKSVRG